MKSQLNPSLGKAAQVISPTKSYAKAAKYPLGMKELAPDYDLSLSDKAKELSKTAQAGKATESAVDAAKKAVEESQTPSIDIEAPEIDLPSPPGLDTPDIPEIDFSDEAKEVVDAAEKADKAEKIREMAELEDAEKGSVFKPGIFFLGGLEMFSVDMLTGSYEGMQKMAEFVEGGRYYGWDQKSDIIEQINLRDKREPIILVGHSLGGDTAVEIANELNSLEHGFRKVDLLFTIDSVGLNNDIIPSNVKKNIHYFSDEDYLLNDGPNWPKNEVKTKVENHLLTVDHTDLDDNLDIQSHLLAEIDRLV
jgi:hypothetical protein